MKNFEIFKDKTIQDLLEDIYVSSKEKKKQIEDFVGLLAPLITNIEDATMLAPILKDYLDVSVKNDKQLVDLGGLIQKIEATEKRVADGLGSSMSLSDKEKRDLMTIAQSGIESIQAIDKKNEAIIKEFPILEILK
jgi:hypothetical protein